MGARLDTVASFVCEQSGWTLSNLALQKLIYLAQVEYMKKAPLTRLVDTTFEAWNLGPVSPELYHRVKPFGSDAVHDVFYEARRFRSDDPRRLTLKEVCDRYLGRRPAELVELTHWSHGAWARKYEPNIRGIRITDADIYTEYLNRERYSEVWNRINR